MKVTLKDVKSYGTEVRPNHPRPSTAAFISVSLHIVTETGPWGDVPAPHRPAPGSNVRSAQQPSAQQHGDAATGYRRSGRGFGIEHVNTDGRPNGTRSSLSKPPPTFTTSRQVIITIRVEVAQNTNGTLIVEPHFEIDPPDATGLGRIGTVRAVAGEMEYRLRRAVDDAINSLGNVSEPEDPSDQGET